MGAVMLGLATSGAVCSVAVMQGDAVLGMESFPHEMRLLERLMPAMDSALRDAGISLTDLDVIATDVGPGSFTGMRIGVMTAKALAWATGAALIAVSSLEALAHASEVSPVVAVIRARPGTMYWQTFDTALIPRTPPAFTLAEDLVGRIAQAINRDEVGLAHLPDTDITALSAHGGLTSGARVRLVPHVTLPDACTVAAIGAIKSARGETVSPLELTPLYITEPIIGPPKARD